MWHVDRGRSRVREDFRESRNMRVWRSLPWRGRGRTSTPLRIREISEAYGIPERYLVQILLQLKGAGLVASTRGAAGGYRLARQATAISLGEVLTAIDGPRHRARFRCRGRRGRRCWPRSGKTSGPPSVRARRTTIAQLAERCAAQNGSSDWLLQAACAGSGPVYETLYGPIFNTC